MDVTESAQLRCPACQGPVEQDDTFCEQCGARLLEAEDEHAADRTELDLVFAAAVSDRGRVHHRNEDAFHLEVPDDDMAAAVVCDGISSASAGGAAARSAAVATSRVLLEAIADQSRDPATTTLEAIAAAHDAVGQVSWTTRTNRGMPSCTLVCALRRGRTITVGSVGDSRAYWIDRDGARRLTVDDSWAEEQVTDGRLTVEEAMRDPRSHSITHWIGADAPARPPHLTTFEATARGRLLLCTDGLWNYLADAAELVELLDALPAEASPAATAWALVDTALLRGGRDNITVAVLDIDPARSPG
jgi:PPM family protein phosphatase